VDCDFILCRHPVRDLGDVEEGEVLVVEADQGLFDLIEDLGCQVIKDILQGPLHLIFSVTARRVG